MRTLSRKIVRRTCVPSGRIALRDAHRARANRNRVALSKRLSLGAPFLISYLTVWRIDEPFWARSLRKLRAASIALHLAADGRRPLQRPQAQWSLELCRFPCSGRTVADDVAAIGLLAAAPRRSAPSHACLEQSSQTPLGETPAACLPGRIVSDRLHASRSSEASDAGLPVADGKLALAQLYASCLANERRAGARIHSRRRSALLPACYHLCIYPHNIPRATLKGMVPPPGPCNRHSKGRMELRGTINGLLIAMFMAVPPSVERKSPRGVRAAWHFDRSDLTAHPASASACSRTGCAMRSCRTGRRRARCRCGCWSRSGGARTGRRARRIIWSIWRSWARAGVPEGARARLSRGERLREGTGYNAHTGDYRHLLPDRSGARRTGRRWSGCCSCFATWRAS